LTANTGGDALSLSMLTAKPFFFLPAFVIVTVLGALVVPTVTVFPNAIELGLNVSFSEIGVGVAVGVAVAVEVAVAVAVGVAVEVAVGVAVLDGVAVPVGVAVLVAVAVAVGVDGFAGLSSVTKALERPLAAALLTLWKALRMGKSVEYACPVT